MPSTQVKVAFHCTYVAPMMNVKDVLLLIDIKDSLYRNQKYGTDSAKTTFPTFDQVKGMGQSQLFVPTSSVHRDRPRACRERFSTWNSACFAHCTE